MLFETINETIMVWRNSLLMNISITSWFTLTNLTSTYRSTWTDIISANRFS